MFNQVSVNEAVTRRIMHFAARRSSTRNEVFATPVPKFRMLLDLFFVFLKDASGVFADIQTLGQGYLMIAHNPARLVNLIV
jgi:hypothetical protein